jgi:TonB family protein
MKASTERATRVVGMNLRWAVGACVVAFSVCFFGCLRPPEAAAVSSSVAAEPSPAVPVPASSAVPPPAAAPAALAPPVTEPASAAASEKEPEPLPPEFARWQSALVGYASRVTPPHEIPVGPDSGALALYIKRVHDRVHPIFHDAYLATLDRLDRQEGEQRLSNELKSKLEIVLRGTDGSIAAIGVIRSSGVVAFDASVLEAVSRAAPFGSVPEETLSDDGNLYLHWEFHRNGLFACSNYFARPHRLRFTQSESLEEPN